MRLPRPATYSQVETLREDISFLHSLVERLARRMARSFDEVRAELDELTTNAANEIDEQNAVIAELRAAIEAEDLEHAAELVAQAQRHADALEPLAARLRPVAVDPEDPMGDGEVPADEAPSTELPSDNGNGAEDAGPGDTVDETGEPRVI
jgi:hypothetical protein